MCSQLRGAVFCKVCVMFVVGALGDHIVEAYSSIMLRAMSPCIWPTWSWIEYQGETGCVDTICILRIRCQARLLESCVILALCDTVIIVFF